MNYVGNKRLNLPKRSVSHQTLVSYKIIMKQIIEKINKS